MTESMTGEATDRLATASIDHLVEPYAGDFFRHAIGPSHTPVCGIGRHSGCPPITIKQAYKATKAQCPIAADVIAAMAFRISLSDIHAARELIDVGMRIERAMTVVAECALPLPFTKGLSPNDRAQMVLVEFERRMKLAQRALHGG